MGLSQTNYALVNAGAQIGVIWELLLTFRLIAVKV